MLQAETLNWNSKCGETLVLDYMDNICMTHVPKSVSFYTSTSPPPPFTVVMSQSASPSSDSSYFWWLLEPKMLKWFLCRPFQRLTFEKSSLAGLPAEILLGMPEDHDGKLPMQICQKGREKIWQVSWEQVCPLPNHSLLLSTWEKKNRYWAAPGGFWANAAHTVLRTVVLK